MCILIKLNDIVNEYNNTYHRIIKIKPVSVKDNTSIGSVILRSMELRSNNKDYKFKVGDHVKTCKYKRIKDIRQIGPEKVL